MNGPIFPYYDDEPMVAAPAIEAQLVGYVLHDLAALDHVGDLKPYQFEDGTLKAIYQRLQACRRAGDTAVDPAIVAAELPDLVSPADLARIEAQAQHMTPGRVESLASRIIAGWRDRDARRRLLEVAHSPGSADDLREAARRQLERMDAAAPDRATGEDHPLAQFVDFDTTPKAVRWVIPGVVEHGVVTISGARGVGKTSSILPLAMVAAGLHHPDDPLAPKHWRHCIYVVEHVEQAQRIVAGMVEHGNMGIKAEDVRERLHIVEARRLDPGHVAKVGKLYRERFTRTVEGVEVLPLVVLDTKSAVLALDNENDNAEASRAVYALKQGFAGLPTWIIGHIAKTQFGRSDVNALSDRGASAFESDAIQNAYLVQEGDARYLVLGKKRFEPRWHELHVTSRMAVTVAYDEWGEPETTTLRWGILSPPEMSRQEAREQAQEAADQQRKRDMRVAVLDAVQIAWQAGNPLSKNGVKGKVSGKAAEVIKEVESLLADGWLHEVEVPSSIRRVSSKARFLVRLDAAEHDEFERSGDIPKAKQAIPESWKKPAKALVPGFGD